jgi:hypothetical protein
MLSLDNAFSREELEAWGVRIQRLITEPVRFVAEPKLDGLAISSPIRTPGVGISRLRTAEGLWLEDFLPENVTNFMPAYSRPRPLGRRSG